MPAYEEKQPRRLTSLICVLIAFVAIYQPFFLGNWELRGREDRYAAIAMEMDVLHPDTVAHGVLVPFNYPLYPWLAALLLKLGIPVALALRLVSVFSMLIITLLIWEAGRRACDTQTAAVGAVFFMSTLLVIEKSMNGAPYFTSILFVFAAWLAWFTYGVARGKWNTAWIVSLFFCALGFFTDGWNAVIVFIIPLIFQRRPMTVWPKLKKTGFFIGAAVLLALVLIWIIPHWVMDNQFPFQNFSTMMQRRISSYIRHLATYPFEVALRLTPWSLLAWPAFCVAYFPLIKNQMFSRFLRTIVISLFFYFWITPTTTAKSIIYIVPALSILCGVNYWLLVRRHGVQIQKAARQLSILAAIFASLALLFYLLPTSLLASIAPEVRELTFKKANFAFGVCESAAALCVALASIRLSRKKLKIYNHVLMLSISVTLTFWALHVPYRMSQTTKRDLGAKFAEAIKNDLGLPEDASLPPNLVVYKGPHILGLYAPCIYMGAKVVKARNLATIPDSPDRIYLIATQFPVSTKRVWEYVTKKEAPLMYKNTKLFILKGRRVKPEKSNADDET